MEYLHSLLVFALFEDVLFLAVKPQVTFASLSSPAVMDIRRLRRRLLEIDVHNILAKVQNIRILNDNRDNRDNLFLCVVKEILIAKYAC